jgi:hypothetical protein
MGDPALEQVTMTHLERQLHVGDMHRYDTHHPGNSYSRVGDHPGNDHHPHGWDHPHDPSSGWADRIRHGVSEFFGGHSHDAADQIDNALEANAAGRRALGTSLIGLGVAAVLQAVVVALSGSVALLGDTLHNVADANGGAAAGGIQVGPAPGKQALHIRLWAGRGPRWPVRHCHDRPVERACRL